MDDSAELRSVGLRATATREAILSTVRCGDHLDAERVTRGVREKVGHVSNQTVHDGLYALTRAGLLRCTEPAGSPALYETRVGDNHHHLVCRVCGSVKDVDCVAGEAPCLEPASSYGFAIDEAEVVFWGLCPPCQGSSAEEEGELFQTGPAESTG
ncbi:Fur family transcriptional regulator [Nocardiopsis sp. CNT312]|uniref:Fur family transcriptional regulator n=1 Tax=Nocardiopsis sp. CNT312 TaxID=1137268 RepID=UPI0004B407FB|nr:Fur family transcriptional regulator [Nocardiopsis sp. CNT312]